MTFGIFEGSVGEVNRFAEYPVRKEAREGQ